MSSPLRDRVRRPGARWAAVWPLGALLLLAGLAAARPLMAGYPGAAAAAAILVTVPGSLTLGAVLSPARRPAGPASACWAVLLGIGWCAFASLALSVLGVRITAASLSWSLLAVCAALAAVAQTRLLLRQAPRGVRAARGTAPADAAPADTDPAGTVPAAAGPGSPAGRGSGLYAAAAIAAGVSLLAGGTYLRDRLPRPAPAGYTWLAWTRPQASGVISIGPRGTQLHFEITRRDSGTASFQLTALWAGTTRRRLAGPLQLRLGPDRTYRGSVLVPAPPRSCAYRIALILRADRQTDPLTGKPQVWAINADVRRAGAPAKPCT